MILAHENETTGFWVATAGEVEIYLGYPAGHFGSGFYIGRWLGVSRHLGSFATLEEAIAAEHSVPNNTVARRNPSNAFAMHLAALANND